MDGSKLMGELDLGQVFTSARVAAYMAGLFAIPKNGEVLDPCFGAGAFLHALREAGFSHISGYELDAELFRRFASAGFSLRQADFLAAEEAKQYDGIIMNPPYVRQEKIDLLKPYGISKAKLRKNPIYAALPASANLYMYFIAKAVRLLRPAGELVVIFPGSWLKARSGQAFQTFLHSVCTLLQHTVITGEVFEQNALVEVVILKLQKGAGRDVPVKKEYIEVAGGELRRREADAWAESLHLPLPFYKIGRVRRGITTGCNAMFINPPFENAASRAHLREILSTPKAVSGYSTEGARTDRLLVWNEAAERTREAEKHLAFWKKKITREQSPKTLYQKIKAGAAWYALRTADCRGILFSYFVRNDMKFILNTREILVRDNFYILYPEISEGLLFALLSSYYTYYQLEAAGKRYGAGLLKIQRYDIENLTFPDYRAFAAHDIARLEALAYQLAETGDRALIAEITRVLAPYCPIDDRKITERYEEMKKSRLEQAWR